VTSDLQGLAMVITAVGSMCGAVCAGVAAIWSVKSHATIEKVGTDINGRMSQFMAEKDKLTEARVAGSFKAGELAQKEKDGMA
jgi:hypothetical protein